MYPPIVYERVDQPSSTSAPWNGCRWLSRLQRPFPSTGRRGNLHHIRTTEFAPLGTVGATTLSAKILDRTHQSTLRSKFSPCLHRAHEQKRYCTLCQVRGSPLGHHLLYFGFEAVIEVILKVEPLCHDNMVCMISLV